MSVNRKRPYVYLLPEDDANRQLAVGFANHYQIVDRRQVQVLPIANGWLKALGAAKDRGLERELKNELLGHLILLIDFDEDLKRRELVKNEFSPEVRERIFVLGCLDEVERLKEKRSLEKLGEELAGECVAGPGGANWSSKQLENNTQEIATMSCIRKILFGSNDQEVNWRHSNQLS